MATLEKIRSKSVLLVVIIAVALLAFILGDAITNGRNLFGNNTTVAKVGSDKIDFQDYQRKQQEISQRMQQQQNVDGQVLGQMALDEMINEMLINDAVEAMSIKTSPELLRYYMIELPGQNPNAMLPEMQQLLVSMNQNNLPVNTPAEAYEVIFTPQKYGYSEQQVKPFQNGWIALESRYSQMLGQQNYYMLLGNSFKANALDKEAMRKDYVASANVKVVRIPYGELSEKDYPVSDDELKKAYEAQKEKYALDEETKEVSFISVSVTPSEADRAECSKLEAQVVKELKAGAITKETRKNGLDVQRHESLLANVRDAALKNFLATAPIDSVAVIPGAGFGFNVARLNARTNKVDSVEIVTVAVAEEGDLVTRVREYLASGEALDSISVRFSMDSVQYMPATWYNLYADNMPKNLGLQEAVFDSLMNSTGRFITTQSGGGATVLLSVRDKKSAKEVVEYETVGYVLHPSEATLADARQKLQKFITDNNTAAKFAENAQKAGYMAMDEYITPSTPAIPTGFGSYYPESRSLVRWIVMDGKEGEVSKIYQSKDPASPVLYAAAVLKAYKDYLPYTSKAVKDDLTAQVRRDKAGDEMVKKYGKGTVEAAAQSINTTPTEVPMLKSNGGALVTDAKVRGRILGSKASNKVQATKGSDAVYVYVINSVADEQIGDDTALDFGNIFLSNHQLNPTSVLRGNKKVQNNIYKFEQGE